MDAIYSKAHPQTVLFKHVRRDDIRRFGDRLLRTDWSEPREYLQVATISTGPERHEFAPHMHIRNERRITCTQESWYVITGEVTVRLYDVDDSVLGEVRLDTGDLLVTFGGGHGYCLEAHGVVLEHKNGPYLGRDSDKRFIA